MTLTSRPGALLFIHPFSLTQSPQRHRAHGVVICNLPPWALCRRVLRVRQFEYLTDKKRRDKINELLKKEEGISMANQVLMTISRDERERERLMQEERILLDYYSGINYMKKKGLAEGIEIGEQRGEKRGEKRGIQIGTKKGNKEGRKEERRYVLGLIKQGISIEEIEQLLLSSG